LSGLFGSSGTEVTCGASSLGHSTSTTVGASGTCITSSFLSCVVSSSNGFGASRARMLGVPARVFIFAAAPETVGAGASSRHSQSSSVQADVSVITWKAIDAEVCSV